MATLLTVLDTNRQLIQFLYGQAFFIAALAIALRVNRDSNFRLASCIWLFALFAVLHAFSEWGEVFIPLQRAYLPDAFVHGLQFVQILMVGTSFIVLYEFGAFLLVCLRPTLGWLRLLTLPLGAAWVASFVFGSSLLPNFTNILPSWWGVYGWFFGVAIGGAVYYALVKARGAPAPRAARAAE